MHCLSIYVHWTYEVRELLSHTHHAILYSVRRTLKLLFWDKHSSIMIALKSGTIIGPPSFDMQQCHLVVAS